MHPDANDNVVSAERHAASDVALRCSAQVNPFRWKRTPWDANVLGLETFEIEDPSPEDLASAHSRVGHYTVRMTPLKNTSDLAAHCFYYCDTLVEPFCDGRRFRSMHDARAEVVSSPDAEAALVACRGAFRHGRFHRDFAIHTQRADLRYENWLQRLLDEKKVVGLNWEGRQAGFFAVEESRAVLHALDAKHRGRGIAKYLWSAAYEYMFAHGCSEVSSSVSVANIPVMNLYASLGFRFRKPMDLYHLLVNEGSVVARSVPFA